MKCGYTVLIRWPERLFRSVAWTFLACFLFECVTPAVVAAQTLRRESRLTTAPQRDELESLADAFIGLEATLLRLDRRLNGQFEFKWQEIAAAASHATPPKAAERAQVKALEDELDATVPKIESLQGQLRAYFAQNEQHLRDKHAAPEILERQLQQAAQYEQRYAQLKDLLHDLKTAKTEAEFKTAVTSTLAFLKANSANAPRAPYDPTKLAFGVSREKSREASADPAEVRKAARVPDGPTASLKTAADATLPPELAETDDVQFTDAIRAKAAALNKNPLAIYQWVRNTVEFTPTYGSIQGSDYTLKAARGNPFDQSSLLIALLRASGIPARYVYGTAEFPIDQVMNWVGGVTSPSAAVELLGQGGIPVTALTEGGTIKRVRIEHVWVEAFVDYVPSRGAKQVQGDTWIALDPSFKQYDYNAGYNVAAQLSFDAQQMADHLSASATTNASEGWVQNVDIPYLATQLGNYATTVEDYVNQQSAGATMGDVLGTRTLHEAVAPYLPASLNALKSTPAARFTALPDTLRWKFEYLANDQPMLSRGLPALAGRRLALAFAPASDADRTALESYVPNTTNPDDLPKQLPAGTIKVRSEFAVDGTAVATGGINGLGESLAITERLYQPGRGWSESHNELTAGDYQAVAIDVGNRASEDLTSAKAALQAVRDKLDRHEYTSLSRHELPGALLQDAALSYFAQTATKTDLAARMSGAIVYRLPSYGTVSAGSSVSYFFGLPRAYKPNGMIVDMDRMAFASSMKSGDKSAWKTLNVTMGSVMSAQEHATLEELFSTPTQHQEGTSAVKALGQAMRAGQKIYSIDEANVGVALAAIQTTPEVKQEIADAVAAGHQVLVHDTPLTVSGHAVTGYVILDKETGSAAFKISTGDNGGAFWFTFALLAIAILVALFALLAAAASGAILVVLGALWAFYWAVDTFADWVERIGNANNSTEFNQASFLAAVQALLSFTPYAFLRNFEGALAAALFGDAFVRIWDCLWYNGSVPWCLF